MYLVHVNVLNNKHDFGTLPDSTLLDWKSKSLPINLNFHVINNKYVYLDACLAALDYVNLL